MKDFVSRPGSVPLGVRGPVGRLRRLLHLDSLLAPLDRSRLGGPGALGCALANGRLSIAPSRRSSMTWTHSRCRRRQRGLNVRAALIDIGARRRCRPLARLALGGTPDPAANLFACRNGWPSCDRSRLTLPEMTELALAERARNVSNCRSGLSPCEQRKLTEAESIAVAVAAYDRNVSNCTAGFSPCDPVPAHPVGGARDGVGRTSAAAGRLPDGIGGATRPGSPSRRSLTWRAPGASAPSPTARMAARAATTRS